VIAQKTLTGKVIGVTDGDTFKLLTQDSIQHQVRLANIDCPERKQAYYNNAKEFLSKAIFGKQVTIHILKKDRYRRLIAVVWYDDGTKNVNQELVVNGLAWHFVKYSKDPELQALEDTARKNKLGLWQDPHAIAPWEWRDNRKKQPKL
jgi:endonuclease YncB( thermonuclease family)